MTNVLIKTDSHYKVDRKRIRQVIDKYLREKRARGNFEISINIVGNRMLRQLNKKYRKEDEVTAVLAFPQFNKEDKNSFAPPPDGILRLGDIVISYPQAIELAYQEEKLVDDVLDSLVIHGMNHLFGHGSG